MASLTEAIDNADLRLTSGAKLTTVSVRASPSRSYRIEDQGKNVEAEDKSYYLRSGNLTAADSRLRVAKLEPDGNYKISTFQLRSGEVFRATRCVRDPVKGALRSYYDCYYASQATCLHIGRELKKRGKLLSDCKKLNEELFAILPYKNADYVEFAAREAREAQSFATETLPLTKIKFDPQVVTNVAEMEQQQSSALQIFADLGQVANLCSTFFPTTISPEVSVQLQPSSKKAQ